MGQMIAIAVALGIAVPPVAAAGQPVAGAKAQGHRLRGYRLQGYRWDAVLGQRWAVFEDAGHPERPLVSELDPDGASSGAEGTAVLPVGRSGPMVKSPELAVHSGDPVTLWRDEGSVRMQLAAVSEGNAAIGGRVQLRVTGAGIFGNTGWRAAGIVRGPGSVEME